MKKAYIASTITVIVLIVIALFIKLMIFKAENNDAMITVGFVNDGDEATPYTNNFIRSSKMIEAVYGDKVEVIVRNNISEEDCEGAFEYLVEAGCDLIISTSYGYGVTARKYAEEYPNIEICQATCSDANTDPVLPNYHNFMGRIYEGRYVSGLIAGLKMKEMIDKGIITPDQALIGYVAAYPYAEVISGYTAFFMGVSRYVPEVRMIVKYTYTWDSYSIEKDIAEQLIDEGCVIISQHSDTIGPAVACENSDREIPVYHVGYNQSMLDYAPTTTLVSCRINWTPYIVGAVEACLQNDKIENYVDATIMGNDASAGFEKDWVQMIELNGAVAAEGSTEVMNLTIRDFKKCKIKVFYGEYTGTNPYDPNDTIDLREGFEENAVTSAPQFCYILDDVITIEE